MNVFRYAPHSLKQTILYRRLSSQRRLRRLQKEIAISRPLNVVIGAGPTKFNGWLETDKDLLNITSPDDWRRLFKPASIDRLLAEHVWEHLDDSECRIALRECHRYLKPSGLLRIAVPDGFNPDPSYLAAVRPGGSGPGSDDHRVLYNHQTLSHIASEERFACDLLEYFDERRQFHHHTWNIADGFVERSEDYDPRNKQRPLSYTSLIVDLRPQPRVKNQPEIS
jgi:predicted SAM-dependent methyltransferase